MTRETILARGVSSEPPIHTQATALSEPNEMHLYEAYLLARNTAEDFLLAYARELSGDETAWFSKIRAQESFSKLAGFLAGAK